MLATVEKLIQSGAAAGEIKGMHSPDDRVLHSPVRISFELEPEFLTGMES